MPMKPKDMIKLLLKNGFIHIKSNNGSHQKFINTETKKTVIVPLHSKEMGKGLEDRILKDAGLK